MNQPSPPEEVLARYDLGRIESHSFLANAGGFSGARLWKVNCDRGFFALRKWPAAPPSNIQQIHQILQSAFTQGIPVAAPVLNRAGDTLTSCNQRYWELATWMPGTADFNSTASQERLSNTITHLAAFHRLRTTGIRIGPSPSISQRIRQLHQANEIVNRLPTEIIHASGFWKEVAFGQLPTLKQTLATLKPKLHAFVDQPLQLTPVIRDIHHDHLLFSDESLTGIVDFEATQVDTPCLDLARLIGSLKIDGNPPWSQAIKYYQQSSPLTSDERQLIPVLHACNLSLGLLNWLKWVGIDNRSFDNEAQVQTRVSDLSNQLQGLDLDKSLSLE